MDIPLKKQLNPFQVICNPISVILYTWWFSFVFFSLQVLVRKIPLKQPFSQTSSHSMRKTLQWIPKAFLC